VKKAELKEIVKEFIKPSIKIIIFVLLYSWIAREFIL